MYDSSGTLDDGLHFYLQLGQRGQRGHHAQVVKYVKCQEKGIAWGPWAHSGGVREMSMRRWILLRYMDGRDE